jgi:hypothetical protein
MVSKREIEYKAEGQILQKEIIITLAKIIMN